MSENVEVIVTPQPFVETISINAEPLRTASVDVKADNVASYYYELSKQWAISDSLVENLDYSSKYYANISQTAADSVLQDAGFIAVSQDLTNIDTVAGSISDVNTVASNITDINTVASDISNINAVYADLSNIDSAVSNATNINACVSNASNINTVAGSISNVNTVGANISDVNTVAGSIGDVHTVAIMERDVKLLADDIAAINAVYSDLTNIDTVSSNLSYIENCSDNVGAISTCSTNISKINTCANNMADINELVFNIAAVKSISLNLSEIDTVANDISNVNAVASNATNINTCSTNITDINTCAANIGTIGSKASISLDNLNSAGKARIAVKQYLTTETYNTDDIVIAIIDNQVSMYKSLIDNNINNPLSDTTSWEKINLGGGAKDIGDVSMSITPKVNACDHLLDGALILGGGIYNDFVEYIAGLTTDYPDLFETEANWQSAVTTYGVCGKFVYDSVNNTVRLPKITGIVEGTTDLTALGDLVQAGLPNITGTFSLATNGISSGILGYTAGTGAFDAAITTDAAVVAQVRTDKSAVNRGWNFNASRSSSIYGNSNKNQPQTIKVLFYICIATTAKTSIEVDIDEIATDLNGKVDKAGDTMTGNLTIEKVNPVVVGQSTVFDITATTAPASNIVGLALISNDKNGIPFSNFTSFHDTNNNFGQVMSLTRKVGGVDKSASFSIGVNSSGADFANGTTGVKQSITNWSFPSATFDTLTFGASGTAYTAPADGWFCCRRISDGSATGVTLVNESAGGLIVEATTNVAAPSIFIPAKKGDTVRLYWVNGATSNSLTFHYAVGG